MLRGEYLRPRCERYLRKGVPIPFDLRNFYIINTYRKAVGLPSEALCR
ncbi:MAG: hypothetical protein R2818_08030 [Flavobacteriales bacterium]